MSLPTVHFHVESRHFFDKNLVVIVVVAEHLAKFDFFIGVADLVSNEPSGVVEQPRLISVVAISQAEKIDPLLHPVVTMAIVVEVGGNVVREIVTLKLPHANKVGLQTDNLIDRR